MNLKAVEPMQFWQSSWTMIVNFEAALLREVTAQPSPKYTQYTQYTAVS